MPRPSFFRALAKGWTLRKTHNLPNLLEEASAHDVSLENSRPVCQTITQFYFTDRYPALPGEERAQVDTSEAGGQRMRQQAEPLTEALRRGLSSA